MNKNKKEKNTYMNCFGSGLKRATVLTLGKNHFIPPFKNHYKSAPSTK